VRLHAHPSEADLVFSAFSERLWRSLASFRGECSVRSWTYRVARAASTDHRRVQGRRPPHTSPEHIERVAAQVRTATRSYLKTETRTGLQALRDSLDPTDQLLLVLRVDRGLSWAEVAEVFREEGEIGDQVSAAQLSARLRQRFTATKKRLRRLAREGGLLEG
jgi:RNA polymerase sigma-70 factor (ECF subfamily)